MIAWLEGRGLSCYQEVDIPGEGRADIVGVEGRLVVVVELKLRLTWELIRQARRWRAECHQVWVAVPKHKRSSSLEAARLVFSDYGIGILEVGPSMVSESARPAFNRWAKTTNLTKFLRPEQKTVAQAGSSGSYWTPFKATSRDFVAYVQAHPGVTLREVVRAITHHYKNETSAVSNLKIWVEKGVLKGVQLKQDGRALRVYPL